MTQVVELSQEGLWVAAKPGLSAAAAIDRLVRHSVTLDLNLPSYRIKAAKTGKKK